MAISRTCDRCGAKSSPWIPRKRSAQGEMLCVGCHGRSPSVRTAATKQAELEVVPDRRPYGASQGDFGWDDDLGPEGVHPLAAPLPNSVWERFAKRQELRGKPLVPMASQRIINARMRGESVGLSAAAMRTVAAKPELPHPKDSEDGIAAHFQKHHSSLAEWEVSMLGHAGLKDMHDKAHATGSATHTHTSGADSAPGAKGEAEPPAAPKGKAQYGHPGEIGTTQMDAHLIKEHGISPGTVGNASTGATSSVLPSQVLHGLHVQAHSQGIGTDYHEHDGYGKGDFTHQTPYGVTEHLGHLKHAHGLTDSDLAQHHDANEAQHSANLTALHGTAHGGTTHWGDPGHTHSGHGDIGKYFTESTGDLGHLMGSHHLGDEDLKAIKAGLPPGTSPDDAVGAYEDHHQKLHAALGTAADHQHAPTTHPDVLTPEAVAREAMIKHLKDHHDGMVWSSAGNPITHHKVLHNPGPYSSQKTIGHEHQLASDSAITQGLPSQYDGDGNATGASTHHAHPTDMDKYKLRQHLLQFHGKHPEFGLSHEEMLQGHAQDHSTGDIDLPHSHEVSQGGLDQFGRKTYGGAEPEPQWKTHPAIESESTALSHLITHHPNVTQEQYAKAAHYSSTSLQDFHNDVHDPASLHDGPPDGHDHAEPQGPFTTIGVGSHLVDHHGLSQSQVASMTPKEFKAHHEELHARHNEMDLGHAHTYPGGPVRAPQSHTFNSHHLEMRDDTNHPAVHEWYHGTDAEYDGAPKNATELQEDHNRWGNFGAGDWNNHAGTHWTSLHQMARNFGSGRVIHAKLHMQNPVSYNSLNHMSHDAYERLHASGDMQDDGGFLGRHSDDDGYNHCCSDRLLEYAKGAHRSDGKYGMERFRDSLRASGHDGVVVRNQADVPIGHWNAMPLSADQIEITHGSCHDAHGDERDKDTDEFAANQSRVTRGWVHPQTYHPTDYTGGKPLPDTDQVDGAGARKKQASWMPPHIQADPKAKRGDADPYRNGRDLGGGTDGNPVSKADECTKCHSDEHATQDCDNFFCSHCNQWGDHEMDDCTSKWCGVCDSHGDHTESEQHDFCNHCGGYADHSSSEHEDEWGEHPDKIRPEGYCPHCETSTKQNYGKSTCTDCGKDLPNWGHMKANGTPVAPEDYSSDGDTPNASYTPASKTPTGQHIFSSQQDLASHLYHHHKSDVSGNAFEDGDGEWHMGALHYHHQHLHAAPGWAKSQGFTADHEHPQFGALKAHEAMTPAEMHAHLILGHASVDLGGKDGSLKSSDEVLSMPSEHAHDLHQKLHAAQDAIPWGMTDNHGDFIPKVSHHHESTAPEVPSALDPDSTQTLAEHLAAHGLPGTSAKSKGLFEKSPGVAEALHQQLHSSLEPGAVGHHTHGETQGPPSAEQKAEAGKQLMLGHLATGHGFDATHALHGQLQEMSPTELATHHQSEHTGSFPMGSDPDHEHNSSNPHSPDFLAPEKPKPAAPEPEKKFISPQELTTHGGSEYGNHLYFDHPELRAEADHPGFDHSPGSPKHSEAVAQAIKAHLESHKKDGDTLDHHHGAGFTAHGARRSTLTDFFTEVMA